MSGIKVLLVEDHTITRFGICRLLEKNNFTVVGEAGDGEQPINLAVEKKPDVIIMDIALPKLSGVQATRQIKQLCPTSAILILSAYDDDEYIFSLLEMGVAGYLLKTASGEELIRAVESVYKGESILDNAITNKVIHRFVKSGEKPPDIKQHEALSERELEILKLAAKGLNNKEIADQIFLSRRTIEGYLRSVFNKLGVGSRTEAVIHSLKMGWFNLADIA